MRRYNHFKVDAESSTRFAVLHWVSQRHTQLHDTTILIMMARDVHRGDHTLNVLNHIKSVAGVSRRIQIKKLTREYRDVSLELRS